MVKNNCEIKLGLHLTSPSLQTACNPHNLGPIPGSTKALALAFKVTVLWILGTNTNTNANMGTCLGLVLVGSKALALTF